MKKNGADLEGLLPKSYCEEIFCIAREWVVLQRSKLKRLKVSCNTLECIAIEGAGLGGNCIAIQISG